jgi:hypothetical protein
VLQTLGKVQVKVFWVVTPCSGAASVFNIKMEAARSLEVVVSCCNTTWCHNAENLDLNLHHCKS